MNCLRKTNDSKDYRDKYMSKYIKGRDPHLCFLLVKFDFMHCRGPMQYSTTVFTSASMQRQCQ